MSTVPVIGNRLYKLYNVIDQEYLKLAAVNKGISVDTFFEYLDTDKSAKGVPLEPNNIHKTILKELMQCINVMVKMENTDLKYFNSQIARLDSRRKLFITMLILIIIGFIVMCILVIKQQDIDVVSRVKNILLLMIILNVIVLLYGILSRYINFQIKKFQTEKSKIKLAIGNYESFMYNGIGSAKKEQIKIISNRLTSNPPITDSKPANEIDFIKSWWYSKKGDETSNDADTLIRIVKNVYRKGNGATLIKLIETKSSNIKRLSGVNDILGYYYSMILRSQVAPDESESSNDKVLQMIDRNFVSQLKKLNIVGLYDDRKDKDDILKRKIENSERFKRILAGFQYYIYYMYLVYRLTPYQITTDILAKKELAITPEIKEIHKRINKYKSIEYVIERYPINIKALMLENNTLRNLGTTPDDFERKAIIEVFIKQTIDTFQKIETEKSGSLFQSLNAIPNTDTKAIKQVLIDFTRNFNDYFISLYTDFIVDDFRNLNANGSQYFMFDTEYMKSLLDPVFTKVPFATLSLEEVEDNPLYKDIVYSLIDDLISKQKENFRSTYFKYDQEENPSMKLKAILFEGKMEQVMDTIVSSLVSKNIRLKDYTQYIVSNIVDKNSASASNVQVKIEEIIANVDFNVANKKSEQKKSDDPLENRFVDQKTFISQLDDRTFNSFMKSLQIETLKELLEFQEADYKETFADKDYSVSLGQWTFASFSFIASMFYIWYATTAVPAVYEMYKNKSKTMDLIFSIGIKLIIPLVTLILFLTIYKSYVAKATVNTEFNKNVMRDNTNTMKEEADNIYRTLIEMQTKLNASNLITPIGNIDEITDVDKNKLYTSMKNILIAYDKCNYVIGTNRYEVPFPYAEVFANGLMIAIIIGMMVYVIGNFTPIERVVEVKDLYEYRETAATLANDISFIQEVTAKAEISEGKVENIMGITKIIVAAGIIIFMLVYSVKIMDTNQQYPYALRNKETNSFAKNNLCVRN